MLKITIANTNEQPIGCLREKSQDLLIALGRYDFYLVDLTRSAGSEIINQVDIGTISGYFTNGGDQSELEPKYSLFGANGGGRVFMIDFVTSTPQITGKLKGLDGSAGKQVYGIKAIPASALF